MSETIPEEVWKAAREIFVILPKESAAIDAIARALLARVERAAKEEREACAKVAEREAGVSPSSVIVPAVAFRIASAIRDRSKT